jgi:hypothetical protein
VASITAKQVLDCLRSAEERDLVPLRHRSEPSVDKLLAALLSAQQQVTADVTLRELAIGKSDD